MTERTLHARDLCGSLNRLARNMTQAEAEGQDLPGWLKGLAGGALVVLRTGDLTTESRMLIAAGVLAAAQALPPDLRRQLEGEPLAGPVPDGVSEDLE